MNDRFIAGTKKKKKKKTAIDYFIYVELPIIKINWIIFNNAVENIRRENELGI